MYLKGLGKSFEPQILVDIKNHIVLYVYFLYRLFSLFCLTPVSFALFQFSGSVIDFKTTCEPSSLYRLTAFTIPAPVKYLLGFVSFSFLYSKQVFLRSFSPTPWKDFQGSICRIPWHLSTEIPKARLHRPFLSC